MAAFIAFWGHVGCEPQALPVPAGESFVLGLTHSSFVAGSLFSGAMQCRSYAWWASAGGAGDPGILHGPHRVCQQRRVL